MKKTLAVVMAFATCTGTAAAAPPSPRDRIGAYLDQHWPRGASGTVLVARGSRAITCRGFGAANRAGRTAAGCDTVYDIMSMTKQFTAAAILKLEMMGRLRVTDRIGAYVDSVPADKQAITLRHLLTHTSGLVESLGDDYDPLSREQLIAGAMGAPLRSRPGATHHYSNVGYSLLAAIIERAAGMSYERFLARHVFAPAGMRHTGYVLPRWTRARVAVEYDRRGRSMGRPFDHPWAEDGPYWNLRGNGGLLSTARDMLRWHRALIGDGVLSRRAKRKLFKPRVPVPTEGKGVSSGYGWGVLPTDHGPIAAHAGGNGWSLGVIARRLRDDVLVFWVSNRAYAAGRWNLERQYRELTLGLAERAR